MNLQEFRDAVMRTRTLLESFHGGRAIAAERNQAEPYTAPHLSWMLANALGFYGAGRVEKANRWLGYVQGCLAVQGAATLDELKQANMPVGETFDPERV